MKDYTYSVHGRGLLRVTDNNGVSWYRQLKSPKTEQELERLAEDMYNRLFK